MVHDSTKARACAMWAARSTSRSATPREVGAVAFTTVLTALNVEGLGTFRGGIEGWAPAFGDH